jgi:AAA ATPase domain
MSNKQRILKSFAIRQLFGTTDVMILFEDKAKILIGVNGLGKTQVLNILYYTLSKKFEKLIEYVFDSITIEFADNEKIEIDKLDVEKSLLGHPSVKKVVKRIGLKQLLELRDLYNQNDSLFDSHAHQLFQMRLHRLPISHNLVLEALEVLSLGKGNELSSSISKKKQEVINRHLKDYQILYFPTYRRVEEDLRNLGYDEEQFGINREDNRLIHFGMNDVEKRFKELTQKIEKLSKEGFAKISSEILSQLVKGLPTIDNNFLHTINQKDIEIILARVGNQITIEDKNRIKDIVSTKKIQVKDHSLLYFLQKLIHIYDQQRELDQSIKIFRDICNKYLVNKKIIYNESSIEIYVQSDGTIEQLPLSKLSSGEKQIISIFSKVYLVSEDSRFIVFFDEPELSLAIDWQRDLLPDIVKSGKCHFLLAVTHSPFIFENELDIYAIGLNAYLKPSKLLSA